MRILQIGGGNMGGALLARWAESGRWSLSLVDPGEPEIPQGVEVFPTLRNVPSRDHDVLIVAVKPQIIDAALDGAADRIKPGTLVISIAAGVPAARFTALLGDRPVVRAMPNLPVRIGFGLTGLHANERTGDGHREAADDLFTACGGTVWLDDEDGIDRFTAVAGSGPGYVFEMLRSYAAAAEELGFAPAEARRLAAETVRGTVALALETGAPFDELRDSVTSRRGTTEAGLAPLRAEDGLESLFRRGLSNAYARALELRS